jgi:hypothetical protein
MRDNPALRGRLSRLAAWCEVLALRALDMNLTTTATEAMVLADIIKAMDEQCVANMCSVPLVVLQALALQVDECRETCDRIDRMRWHATMRKAVQS